MPRTHGYALQGRRCYGVRDWRARGRTNVIGAMIGHLLLTVGLFNSNIDADTFQGWTAQDLLPKLPPRCVIVMDNAAFHKRRDIQNLILKGNRPLQAVWTI